MKYIVPVDPSAFPETFRSLHLAGPETGLDSARILVSRVPPGHKGPRLHIHPVDQFYYILEGTTTLQIGTEVFTAGPDTLVHFPAGVPHCNWNDTDETEMHLEIMVPAPAKETIIDYDVEARAVPDAGKLIYKVDPEGYPAKNFASQHLANRATGSHHALIYVAKVQPGSGGPALHFHQFDQLYFILEGDSDIQIGLTTANAPKHSLVILPRGVLHTNRNTGAGVERHLTILIPEPQAGEQFDYKVEVQYQPDKLHPKG